SYKGKFLDNTYINSIDVSGKTKDEAIELVKKNSVIPEVITIQKVDGTTVAVKLSEIGYTDNTETKITEFFNSQSHVGWVGSKLRNTEFSFDNYFKYDKEKLEAELKRKLVDVSSNTEPQNAYIKKADGNEYVIVKEKYGDKIDAEKVDSLYEYVESFLDERSFTIDLTGAKIYESAEITAESLQETCDKLNNIYNISITFDFGYTNDTVTGDTIMDWITLDDEEHAEGYTVDEDKAMAYVESLAEKYDTYGKDRQFESTNRGTITVSAGSGCYGWWIDQEKTRDLLVELIEEGDSANTEPIYYKNPDSQYEYTCNPEWRTSTKDWSDTYIEIDLSAQHLWYYKDGKIAMETDIVSGYPNASRNTPEGVYKLWYKEKAKTLRGSADGESYASYVDYWNNISTIGIGLHDASWQNGVFGGTKYQSQTWGSHGCINMPFDKAKYVYDNIELGTPVFAYWS
ncbi:MAG: L,D-transpeptidase family protein, partial [Hominimerdicola sp.]